MESKAQLLHWFDYHMWATDKALQHLKTLPAEVFVKEVNAGFVSIADNVGHIVNHGTYHRGNITTFLRCQGYSGVSSDYIYFLRK